MRLKLGSGSSSSSMLRSSKSAPTVVFPAMRSARTALKRAQAAPAQSSTTVYVSPIRSTLCPTAGISGWILGTKSLSLNNTNLAKEVDLSLGQGHGNDDVIGAIAGRVSSGSLLRDIFEDQHESTFKRKEQLRAQRRSRIRAHYGFKDLEEIGDHV